MPNKINILHLRDSPWFDGPGRTIVETGRRMDSERFNYYVAGFVRPEEASNPFLDEARLRGCRVFAIEESSRLDLQTLKRLRHLVEELDVHILHAHEFRSNLMTLLCRPDNSPVRMTTVHGWIANNFKGRVYVALDKLVTRFFDCAVAVSGRIKNDLCAYGVPAEKIQIIHNALMLEEFPDDPERTAFREELRAEPGMAVIINIGRLSREKGQDIFLKAGRLLRDRGISIRLAFVGQGPDEPMLRDLAGKLNMTDVVFCGHRKDMLPIYGGTDVVVQSSFTEGLPNVVLESLWMGVPTVATAVGGTAEVIEDGESGLLVPPGDPAALAGRIEQVLRDENLREHLIAGGRERIRQHFDIHRRVERMEALYTSMITEWQACTS